MIIDNVSGPSVIARAASELSALQDAFAAIKRTQEWLAGISLADLEAAAPTGLAFSAGYAAALKSAYADADALRQIYETGQAPASYPQVTGAPYVYATSQAAVIGP